MQNTNVPLGRSLPQSAALPAEREPAADWKNGAAYVRVSTNDQLELSPESQLKEILDYAQSRRILIAPSHIFMEKEGRSGKRAGNRPEFQRMIATAKLAPRPFDVILVWKFSRFARNQDESTFYKGMLRKKLGIDIISVSEPVIDGMYGRLIELIIEWQDEFYSCNLSSEVRRGMAENARKGGYQAPAPYGYRQNGPHSVPAVIEKEAQAVRFMFTRFAQDGQSPAAIASELNEKGFSTKKGNLFDRRAVVYILKNPFYTGKIRWNPAGRGRSSPEQKSREDAAILSPGRHTPIISEELFERAARRLEAPRTQLVPSIRRADPLNPREVPCSRQLPPFSAGRAGLTGRPPRHFLSGLLRCPACGAALSYSSSQTPVFQCWRYARGLHRGSASISERRAVLALLSSLDELASCETRSEKKLLWISFSPPSSQGCEQDKKLRKLALREQRIQRAYENGIDSLEEYRAKKETVLKERELLKKELECSGGQKETAERGADAGFQSLSDLIRDAGVSTERKWRALRAILRAVIYDREKDVFYFYYCRQSDQPEV